MKVTEIESKSALQEFQKIRHFKISNDYMYFTVSCYGSTISSIYTPSANGELDDIALGFDDIAKYESCPFSPCGLVGRYANRIAEGRFDLNEKTINLSKNDGGIHHIHGGFQGFNRRLWDAEIQKDGSGLLMTLRSPEGEEGYPGNLEINVLYSLSDENEIIINYSAQTDKPTICNPSMHLAVNLGGRNCQDLASHYLKIYSSSFLDATGDGIPTGEILETAGTPLDFSSFENLGKRLSENHRLIETMNGLDYHLNIDGTGLRQFYELRDSVSGRYMACSSDMPGLHIYTANTLDGSCTGKNNVPYIKHGSFFAETQYAPNSVNLPFLAQSILNPGEIYEKTTIYKFGVL